MKNSVWHVIVKYIFVSYGKLLAVLAIAFPILVFILIRTGVYERLATALDLKYNSPIILVPVFGSIALAVICLFIGFLMYFYKYTRPRRRGAFYKAFSKLVEDQNDSK